MMLLRIWRRLYSEIYIRYHHWGYIGHGCRIYLPLKIAGTRSLFIGNRVIIEHKAWLTAASPHEAGEARLEIGNGTIIGHYNHIYATRSIKIGRNVLTADRVYISDNQHGYENITIPVLEQPIRQLSDVEIGDGTWLGEGVCVIGAKIGKGCVIGANAVVTKDIPDYSVAAGVPAHVIKQYNHDTKEWEKVK